MTTKNHEDGNLPAAKARLDKALTELFDPSRVSLPAQRGAFVPPVRPVGRVWSGRWLQGSGTACGAA